MEDKAEIKLINSIKTTVIKTVTARLVGGALFCICALVVFYFNTTYVLAQNVKDTTKVVEEVSEIKKTVNSLKVTPKLNSQKIENIEEDVAELKEGQKEIRKMNQKILELLYQIKQRQND